MNGLRTRLELDRAAQRAHNDMVKPIDRAIAWIAGIIAAFIFIWQIFEAVGKVVH